MPRKVFIFGTHPLCDDILAQCRQRGWVSHVFPDLAVPSGELPPDECVVLPAGDGNGTAADAGTQRFLIALAQHWKGCSTRRPLVHILLREPSTLRMYQLTDFPPVVNEVFEVWPFTMEEAWADHVVVRYPGITGCSSPSLDRQPIGEDSRQFVHLVVAGFDSYAESIAVRAAQIAHFPNYNGKAAYPLRTRITVISKDVASVRDRLVSVYRSFFDHSYYRSIYPDRVSSQLHHPLFEGKREDFVDVEWEFVEGTTDHPLIADRLSAWAKDPRRQLTLVLSDAVDSLNMERAMSLPEAVFSESVPVWVRLHDDILSATAAAHRRLGSILPFGMDREGYDISIPAVRMARLLHYFYACTFADGRTPTVFRPDDVEREWSQVGSFKMRLSNVWNVMTMATKMHSLGHQPDDLSTFYALSSEETEALTRTEHNRWCVERLLSGTRPCTDEEREEVRADIRLKSVYKKERDAHIDLCANDELGTDAQGNDVRIYDRALTASIPLIVESYLNGEGVR